MLVKWKSIKKNESKWITKFVTQVVWSGADTQASRTLEVSLLNSPHDKGMKTPAIALGDIIVWYDDKKKKRFVGRVTSREKTSEIGTVKITAKDYMHNMIASKASYKFKNKTPEYIARAVCKDFGISVGHLVKTKRRLHKYLPNEMSPYDIIVKAYQMVSGKTHKKYMPRMNGTKFEMIEKGHIIQDFALKDTVDITKATYTENIDNMVNCVALYNSQNRFLGLVKKPKWIKQYGKYQTAMTQSEHGGTAGSKISASGRAKAKKEFVGASKTASVEVLGHISCIAGRGVRIRSKSSGLTATYWIKSDTHTFEGGKHTMTLELAFKNVMENPEYNKFQASKTQKSGGGTTSRGGWEYVSTGKKYKANFSAYGTYFNGSGSHSQGAYGTNTAYKTVAGPPAFKRKYLKISGTGTKWDGKIVKVTDTGTGPDGKLFHFYDGGYEFDVCEKTKAEAQRFGRHHGTVTVMKRRRKTTSSGSGSYSGGKMIWPAGTHKITREYGSHAGNDPPRPQMPDGGHPGCDFSVGGTAHAAAAGKVTYAGVITGYGNVLMISHGSGIVTLYAHLACFYVHKGQRVKQGQAIARIDSTGWSTGTHLHFEVRVHGLCKNPRKFLR